SLISSASLPAKGEAETLAIRKHEGQDTRNQPGILADHSLAISAPVLFRECPMLLASLVFSAGLLLIVCLATLGGSRPSYLGAILISLAVAPCAFLFGSSIFLGNAFLVGIVAVTCQVMAARRRTFVASSLLATAVVYVGVIIFFVIPEQREWANLK